LQTFEQQSSLSEQAPFFGAQVRVSQTGSPVQSLSSQAISRILISDSSHFTFQEAFNSGNRLANAARLV
jgi:hypothetical protein